MLKYLLKNHNTLASILEKRYFKNSEFTWISKYINTAGRFWSSILISIKHTNIFAAKHMNSPIGQRLSLASHQYQVLLPNKSTPNLGKMSGFKRFLHFRNTINNCGVWLYFHFISASNYIHIYVEYYMYGQTIVVMNFIFR